MFISGESSQAGMMATAVRTVLGQNHIITNNSPLKQSQLKISTVVEVETMEVQTLDEVATSLRLEARHLRIHQLTVDTHTHRHT